MKNVLNYLAIVLAIVLIPVIVPFWYVWHLWIRPRFLYRNEAVIQILSAMYGTEGCTIECISPKEMKKRVSDDALVVSGYFNLDKMLICIAHSYRLSELCDTFFHERRHAQQFNHMKIKYFTSVLALNSGKVDYKTAWHEYDASRAGRIMSKRFNLLARRF